MQGNTVQPTVIYEDESEMTHRPPYYFCSVPNCICHADQELTGVLMAMLEAKEIDGGQALRIFWNQEATS